MANDRSWHTLAIKLQTARAIGIKVTSPLSRRPTRCQSTTWWALSGQRPGRPSCSARTRCNIVDPVALHRFVSPKIHRNRHRRRAPCELLPEFDFEPGSPFAARKRFRRHRPSSRSVTHRPIRTAVHFRSMVGRCISENRTSLKASAGLQACWPTAWVTPISPITPVSSPDMHARYMCFFSSQLHP